MTLVAACAFPCRRGTAARVLGQALALRRQGVDAEVVTYDLADFDPPADLPIHRIPRVPTHRSTRPGPSLLKLAVLDPLLLWRTFARAERRRPDVLHGHHVEGGLAALMVGRALRIPVVFDAHTSLPGELPSYSLPLPDALLESFGTRLDGFLVRHSQHTFAVSGELRTRLLADAGCTVGTERVSVLPMALEQAALVPPRRAEPEHAPPTVVYAGGLSRFQRLDLLGEAFERLLTRLPEARLLILAEDPARELEASWPGAGQHPRLRFLQPKGLADLFEHLDAAHVAVNPRTSGFGFPQKTLNYMSRALPVVACRGASAAVRHGETGLVVPNDDPDAFAAALATLLRDAPLRRRLGQAGRRTVEDRYAWEPIATQLIETYEVLTGCEASSGAMDP